MASISEIAQSAKGAQVMAALSSLQGRERGPLLVLLLADWGGTRPQNAQSQEEAFLKLFPAQERAWGMFVEPGVLFGAFLSSSDAVAFALKLQAAAHNGLPPDEPGLRIGLHMGEVATQGMSLSTESYGFHADAVARVHSLAARGRILCTEMVFDLARASIKGAELEGSPSLSWFCHGRFQLEGLEPALRICEVGIAGQGVLRSPASSESVRLLTEDDAEPGWRPAADIRVPNSEWVLERLLGKNILGESWLAAHRLTAEKRVFKFCFDRGKVRDLKRELEVLRIIRTEMGEHHGIVRLHDVCLDAPPYYLGLEYVPGRDLRTWLEESLPGPSGRPERRVKILPIGTKLDLGAQIAEALAAAHDAGVVHQDLRPGNILVCEDGAGRMEVPKVKVKAFGTGRIVNSEALERAALRGVPLASSVAAAPAAYQELLYVAPERLEGKKATTQSDIYSLGVLVFQMLVGDLNRAFAAEREREVVDPAARALLKPLLAADPGLRPQRLAGVAQTFRAWRPRGIDRRIVGLGLVGAVVVAGLVFSLGSWGRKPHGSTSASLTFQEGRDYSGEYDALKEIPSAVYHLFPKFDLALVRVKLRNDSPQPLDFRVSATLSGFSSDLTQTVTVTAKGQLVVPLNPAPLIDAWDQLPADRSFPLDVRISVERGGDWAALSHGLPTGTQVKVLKPSTFVSDMLVSGERIDLYRTLAAWVTPDTTEITAIVQRSKIKRPEALRCYSGYQDSCPSNIGSRKDAKAARPAIVESQVRSIYEFLREKHKWEYLDFAGLSSDSKKRSANIIQQAVRRPPQVLDAGAGNCIDLSILMASALQAAGLEPILVAIRGHMMVGWETWEGSGVYDVLEATALTAGKDFTEARRLGRKKVGPALKSFETKGEIALKSAGSVGEYVRNRGKRDEMRVLAPKLLQENGILPAQYSARKS